MVTLGELRAGVLAATDPTILERRLATLTAVLALDPLPIDADVAEAWAGLRNPPPGRRPADGRQ